MKHTLLLLLFTVLTGTGFAEPVKNPPVKVLCLASEDTATQGLDGIEEQALKEYRACGYELHFNYYQKVTEKEIFSYPIVVGMIPMLHAGTRAISPELADVIDRYISAGGGFILIPGPSYYGQRDFHKQLNPFLKRFSIELINEIPVDALHMKQIKRINLYRYLSTTNIKKHPATSGITKLWLPLDYSDSFLRTHTMKPGKEWDVLVKGEKTCFSSPYSDAVNGKPRPGVYASEPPFLAVRDWDKGRIAVFSTASRYYIFDAWHWAHASGFVMRENGLKLMTSLFKYVSANAAQLPEVLAEDTRNASVAVHGNVPVSPDKNVWIEQVLAQWLPKGYGIKYYIDCGALSDLKYDKNRGFGYIAGPGSWLIRWPWSEIFHATASNCRAFDRHSLEYRFDRLDPERQYCLGLLFWAYQDAGARDVEMTVGNQIKSFKVPRFQQKQGPLFVKFAVPQDAIAGGGLKLKFARGKGGDGEFSSISEIWLFESGEENRHADASEVRAVFESPSAGHDDQIPQMGYFRGLNGAKSIYSGEGASVTEMAAAAKHAGLDFLIFNDTAEQLGPDKFQQLKDDCAKVSDANFIAIPGFAFQDRYSDMKHTGDKPLSYGNINAAVFGYNLSMPKTEDYGNPYSLFWKYFGGELNHGARSEVTLRHPSQNEISPFFQRFWRGFNVFSRDKDMKEYDDSSRLFEDLLASGYGPYPMVEYDLRSPEDIAKAAEKWRIMIYSWRINELPIFKYTSAISCGPGLKQIALSFDHMRDCENGAGIIYRNHARAYLHIKTEYKVPISEIIIYNNSKIIRRLYPMRKKVDMAEPLLLTGQSELSVRILASDGTEARSGRIQAIDHLFYAGMCADNQNTINCMTVAPGTFVRDEREIYYQHSYWHTGEAHGQLGILRDARELVPRIIETGIIQVCKYFFPCPVINFNDGSEESHHYSELRIGYSSKDANVISYSFRPRNAAFSSNVRLTSFRPVKNGATIVRVDGRLVAERDIPAGNIKNIRTLALATMPTLPPLWNFSATMTDGTPVEKQFSSLNEPFSCKIKPGSAAGLWPNELANLIAIPLDENPYSLTADNIDSWCGRERLRWMAPGRAFRKGETYTWSFMVALTPDTINTPADMDRIADAYLHPAGVKTITCGTEDHLPALLRFKAEKQTVTAQLRPSGSKDNFVPLEISGLNDATTCAFSLDGKLKLAYARGGIMRCTLPGINKNTQFTGGNLIISDNPALIIDWGGVFLNGVRIYLHNPTPELQRARLTANTAFPGIPDAAAQVALAPGQSKWIWMNCNGAVEEHPNKQIIKVFQKKNATRLDFSDGSEYFLKSE